MNQNSQDKIQSKIGAMKLPWPDAKGKVKASRGFFYSRTLERLGHRDSIITQCVEVAAHAP